MPDWNADLHELVRTRHRALIGYAYLLSGNTREAEDLVQDALVKVFTPRSAPAAAVSEGYVRRAILTIYLDLYRRRRRWSGIKHLVGIADREESRESAVADQVDVAVALDALTPRQRACVVLRYFEDLTVPQIASALGCADGTVKRHLFDAHAILADRLGPLSDTSQPSPIVNPRPLS
ncbi:RNA polymerase sigma-70 factor, ECF subfamily [Sanguibacter gelidistatuariae]|uniref:RNA polymerase sigma-70 factor, ECF subfamily n=1 Tax=Sanguibacter gelidistatuariae TaxID=1814289 RepID=A0A1G6HMS0_9MICO|nr:sigma-70 family RNA polymerase sigma factor [Sanguibacter gelidistatuariae]SDB95531.1 RNA polymerase sigma-70 factor, ECF subfamily [Sanguibacter gelidistatuariae]